ncbi:MAG TPA: alpha/beta hydrolase family protein [Solirubrobacteraceae bacterium]|nr:alpha/beta hydrolase family protein [Solirubrobacteraceae bacterium]
MSSSPPPARGVYLDVGGVEPIFALLHMPDERAQHDTSVLMCPPFGWEDVCSYRSRRAWAQDLAAAGHPTLRLDLPGAGDSGGSPGDARLLDAWTEAIASAAAWLAASTGGRRVAAIGIGLGGLLVCRAGARGGPIAEAVLWAVPAKGRTFVRELRAFGRAESSKFGQGESFKVQPLPRGYVGAGGFVLSAGTARALERLDLATLDFPDDRLRRVLLLERDGIAVDASLLEHLERSGRDVSIAPGTGYDAMMAEPLEAEPPTEVFAAVKSWLSRPRDRDVLGPSGLVGASSLIDEAAAHLGPKVAPSVVPTGLARERDATELTVGDAVIRERLLAIEQPFGRLFAVLAEPAMKETTDVGAVLLNAGAMRRIGPNRMWVELARRWAARGVASLRLDLEGLGDSDGDDRRFADAAELYTPHLVDQVQTAIDVMEAHGVAHRFVAVGLGSGAYWSFHAALRDERVVAALMVNPRALFSDGSQEAVRYLQPGFFQPRSWRMPRALIRRTVARVQALGARDQLDPVLDLLRDADKRLLFVFSENEPLHDELERQGRLPRNERWPNMKLELIPGRDHTLRPHYSQERAHEALDRALDRELSRRPGS